MRKFAPFENFPPYGIFFGSIMGTFPILTAMPIGEKFEEVCRMEEVNESDFLTDEKFRIITNGFFHPMSRKKERERERVRE